jgi:hypothetical protein
MLYELRKLVAFRADVLTPIARIFVDSVFALYRERAKRDGVVARQCGVVNFVQRRGSSINLHVHYHLVVLGGVFARDAEGQLAFHPAHAPTSAELDVIIVRTARRSIGCSLASSSTCYRLASSRSATTDCMAASRHRAGFRGAQGRLRHQQSVHRLLRRQ